MAEEINGFDILNREEFIRRTIGVIERIAEKKGSITFGIDGAWGCGKSFVLNEIENRLMDDPYQRYLVIHYNCWQYDYYEEPIVALVSTMVSFLKNTGRLSENTKKSVIGFLKKLGKTAMLILTGMIDKRTGVNISSAAGSMLSGAQREDENSFDDYLDLNSAIESVKTELAGVTQDKTLVLCVDELDRCLPEYAIKVLERLHHFTEGLPNTAVIIAMDKKRLKKTIESIFDADSTEDYLKKFIRFDLRLDNGTQDGKRFIEKYPRFCSRFHLEGSGILRNTERFVEELFRGIPIREQEQIVEKATVFNDVCFGKDKQDQTMMYMELFLAALKFHYNNESIFSDVKRVTDNRRVFSETADMPEAFLDGNSAFSFEDVDFSAIDSERRILLDSSDVFAIVFYYWYYVPEPRNHRVGCGEFRPILKKDDVVLDWNVQKLRDCIDILNTIS